MSRYKGQSAIEYLTTYGWMLLVVAIVGGAVFTTVQDSSQIQSVSGLANADVQAEDYGLNNEGLQLSLRASASDSINIRQVKIKDPETGIAADVSPSKIIPVGDKIQLNFQDVMPSNTAGTYDLEVVYDANGLTGLKTQGKITGKLNVHNKLSIQEAKFNRSTNTLQISVKNIGDNLTEAISYTIYANNTKYQGTLNNLAKDEKATINISAQRTYPLEEVSLNVEGHQFIDSNSKIKCTPTQGLVGYWTFGEEQTNNGQAIDLSGYGNHGNFIGGVKTSSFQVGEGYSFDGVDDAIKINDSNSLDATKGLTVSLWYRSFQNDSEDYSYILKKGSFSGSSYFWVDEGHSTATSPRITDLSDNWHGFRTYFSNYGAWEHIAYTYNRSEGNLKGYGENGLNSESNVGQYYLQNTSKDILVGRGGPAGWLKADMTDLRIYNRSLSGSEIERLQNVRSEEWAVSGCKIVG